MSNNNHDDFTTQFLYHTFQTRLSQEKWKHIAERAHWLLTEDAPFLRRSDIGQCLQTVLSLSSSSSSSSSSFAYSKEDIQSFLSVLSNLLSSSSSSPSSSSSLWFAFAPSTTRFINSRLTLSATTYTATIHLSNTRLRHGITFVVSQWSDLLSFETLQVLMEETLFAAAAAATDMIWEFARECKSLLYQFSVRIQENVTATLDLFQMISGLIFHEHLGHHLPTRISLATQWIQSIWSSSAWLRSGSGSSSSSSSGIIKHNIPTLWNWQTAISLWFQQIQPVGHPSDHLPHPLSTTLSSATTDATTIDLPSWRFLFRSLYQHYQEHTPSWCQEKEEEEEEEESQDIRFLRHYFHQYQSMALEETYHPEPDEFQDAVDQLLLASRLLLSSSQQRKNE